MQASQYHVSAAEKAAYCLGGIGKDLIYWQITIFFMLYLSVSGRCSLFFVLTLFTSARLFDALTDPLMGYIADITRSSWGKFKPWIAAGTVLTALSTLALFYDPGLSASGFKIYISIVFVLWTVSYTTLDIPYWALIPTFGSQPQVREQMSVLARLGTLLGGQIIIAAGTYLLQEQASGAAQALWKLTLTAVGLFILTQLIMLAKVKDRSLSYPGRRLKFTCIFKVIVHNDELLIILAVTLLQQIAWGLTSTSLYSYLNETRAPMLSYEHIILIGVLAQVLALLCFIPLIKAVGRRRLFIGAGCCMLLGTAVLSLISFTVPHQLALTSAYALFCTGLALCTALTTVMQADSVDYGEFKTGIRTEGLLFAAQTMSAKLGLVAAYLAAGFTSVLWVLLPPELRQSAAPQVSFRLLLLLASAIIVLMLFLYVGSYRLHGVFFKNMLTTLEQIRETYLTPAGQASVKDVKSAASSPDQHDSAAEVPTAAAEPLNREERRDAAADADPMTAADPLPAVLNLAAHYEAQQAGAAHLSAAQEIAFNAANLSEAITKAARQAAAGILDEESAQRTQLRSDEVLSPAAAVRAPAPFKEQDYDRSYGFTPLKAHPGTGILVRYALDKSCIIRMEHQADDDLNLSTVVKELAQRLERLRSITAYEDLSAAVLKKHALSSCAIAEGIAVAHARGDFALRPCMGLAVLDHPLKELVCPDGTICDLIFLIATPDDGFSHLTLLGRLSLMLNEPGFADKLRSSGSRHEIYDRLLQCSQRLTRSMITD